MTRTLGAAFADAGVVAESACDTIERLFLLTGMSEQTIRRTAPAVLPRLFRKPVAVMNVASAVIDACGLCAPRRNPTGPISILLIEDDRPTAQATKQVLLELGYFVHWVRDGREALAVLATREFDAIVLDLVMPHIDGFTMLEHFRCRNPALLRRIVVITGIPDKYLEGFDGRALCGVMRKPLDVATLERLLADCVGGRL